MKVADKLINAFPSICIGSFILFGSLFVVAVLIAVVDQVAASSFVCF